MNFMFEWQEQYSEILFLPLEHKIHIFEPTCNVLLIIWRFHSKQQTRREKPIQQKQKAGIVTSLNDTHKGDIRKIRHSGPG